MRYTTEAEGLCTADSLLEVCGLADELEQS
jgi:hypothetical protein